MRLFRCLPALLLCAFPAVLLAQGAEVAFGGLTQDTTQPVEITADSLSVNQTDGTAIFQGNVIVVQGEMRMSASEMRVDYRDDGAGIESLVATGGVTLATAADAAEAREALYTVGTGAVVMTGDVLLTQGASAISGQRLVLDLKSGTGRMEGRVKTVFVPGTAPEGGN